MCRVKFGHYHKRRCCSMKAKNFWHRVWLCADYREVIDFW
jgi:hypothetical protein